MELSIRYANNDDLNSLAYVHSQSLQTAFRDIVDENTLVNAFSIEKRKQGFQRELSVNKPTTALAFENDNPVGLISFGDSRYIDVDESTIEFWRIYLLPQYWGKDYANKIFNWGINEIRAKGYKKIILWVLEDNVRARKFYEKNNFHHDGTKIQVERGKLLNELFYTMEL